ncbi:SafA/ExsA family spore coat assembly protein [Lentibacillus sp.]|uniref:SafA/ExsA family spore coat assembly protein n=1 Tax=Lentibacillus sp. TaxID=1925746 RepID=UPI002B4B51E1|nr:SafA/ExsA family spore coat assembly protein [Lentibacillus sp.]HLS07562.1 SafA/ExsA family spore coat assembly protein [Lentibacillus sp.]
MKIHIVQKGDTLWEIAKQYGADFEEVKQLNPQLSSPDMIMPGMKIKIPASSKPVKKESVNQKETQKEKQQPAVEKPYKDTSPKPMPIMKEDDVKKPKEVKPMMPKMPMQPKVPAMEQETNYYTTINLPQIPTYTKPEKESSDKHKKMCYQPHAKPELPIHQHMPYAQPSMPQVSPYSVGHKDCGCSGPKPIQMPMYQQPMQAPKHMQHHPKPMHHHKAHMPQPSYYGNMMDPHKSAPSMEMPGNPMHHHNMNNNGSFSPKFPPNPMGMQSGYHYPQMPPAFLSHSTGHHMLMPQPPGFHKNFRDEEDSASE